MKRRSFIISSGILAAGTFASRARAIAGPFLPGELIHNIPVDKKLDPQWVRSLSNRGTVTKYFKSKNELKYIGMPVGGINTGTLYLGGDGRLWLWDIFNANQEGIDPKTIEWGSVLHDGKKVRSRDGSAYVQPAKDIRPLDQGFAFRIRTNGKTMIRKMEATDWDEVIFEATYPMARVHYIDKSLELDLYADIYSPFIPLDDKNSGLPCTIYSFTIKNRSKAEVSVDIVGWLENKTSIRTAKDDDKRINRIVNNTVECSMKDNGDPQQQNGSDFGTMALSALVDAVLITDFRIPSKDEWFNNVASQHIEKPAGEKLIAAVVCHRTIQPSATATADFIYAWHYSNLKLDKVIEDKGRYYNNWFKCASEVADHVRSNFQMLSSESRSWRQTWYDSTLPWWFLERTFMNISTLATTTAHRFDSGRFYAWEGVGCCAGTCMHVWQYAQAMGRVFPSIERDTRERVDLGLSLQPDGMIWYRGEVVKSAAIDGQAGTILRIYREHQMSSDNSFLKNNWEKIRRATKWVMDQDRNRDGMEDTPIENTLDAVWDGEIAWLVGLCIAAVKAGELMAIEMNDTGFANACAEYVRKGRMNMESKLFNGEYFIHKPDAEKGRAKLGSYNTCHIDQVYGQSWAHQVGIGRVLDQNKTVSALKALWKYNFTPDVGPYIKERKGGRPYALPGEGGLVMNTNPANEAKPYGDNVTWQLGYFHECMSGFEHQVASHMMAEGMVDESLVIARMIHDRYHAAKRNPFNEIECSDHYARAMASYGTFITACGFEYHGPKGHLGFAPKLSANKFRAPFITAGGWGTYSQVRKGQRFTAELHLKYGNLSLNSFSFECTGKIRVVTVQLGEQQIMSSFSQEQGRCMVSFEKNLIITKGQKLIISG
jgi:uncharacterized protein (DUF608 family)